MEVGGARKLWWVLGNRHFLALWLAQAVSQTAQNALLYLLMVIIETNTSSSLHMSFLVLSTILPSVIIGMAAGVFVDRWSKRRVLVTTNLLRGAILVLFPLFLSHPGLIYVANLLFATVSQFFAPAEVATIPLVVSRRQLLSANGLFNLTFTISQAVGFIIVAPLLAKGLGVDTPLPFFILALFFALAALLVRFLPRDHRPKKGGGDSRSLWQGVWRELKDGWQLLQGDVSLSLSMVHLTLVSALVLIMGMLVPGYVSRVLGVRADDAVYILGPAGLGILAGIALVPRLGERWGKDRLVHWGLGVMTFSLLSMGSVGLARGIPLGPLVGGAMLFSLVMGGAYAFINIPAQTIIQERAPVDMRGRIFAIQLVFGNVVAVLPLISLGQLADFLGVSTVILILAVGVFVVAMVTYRWTQGQKQTET